MLSGFFIALIVTDLSKEQVNMSEIQKMLPIAAHKALTADSSAVLIDVRDPVESSFVGYPIGAVNVPFKMAPTMEANPNFVEDVRALVPELATPIFLLCRSGQRSAAAAELLAQAGYTQLVNIEEGFEGGMDAARHRSTVGGWRFHKLPWEQS
jgi:rhodanese-related sulfurtransferase